MINIFGIGNSYTEDAHYFLKDLCKSMGVEITCIVPFIGGHTFKRHLNSIATDSDDYILIENGVNTGKHVTFMEALNMKQWDIVTFNQGSVQSGRPFTYFPYINQLADLVKEHSPNAKLYIHETWAYEIDSDHPHFSFYDRNQKYMYERIIDGYRLATKLLGVERIPAGTLIQYMRENIPEFDREKGGIPLTRDGYHMHLVYGRYAVALAWYGKLFGGDVRKVPFIPQVRGMETDLALIEKIKEAAAVVLSQEYDDQDI